MKMNFKKLTSQSLAMHMKNISTHSWTTILVKSFVIKIIINDKVLHIAQELWIDCKMMNSDITARFWMKEKYSSVH